MTMPGGLPTPRPDQRFAPSGSPMAPGSPNVIRARQVIVSGSGANSGVFVYSPAPGPGNLIASIAAADSIDPYGNAVLAGTSSYFNAGSNFTAASLQGGVVSWFESATAGGPWTQFADIGFAWNNITGGSLLLQAGNQVTLGQLGNAFWDEVNQQLNLPAAGGPFINGETFHTLSNPGGIGGTVRVKLLPWNAVWFDAEGTFTYSASQQTFTFGSLPSASYFPAANRHFPVAVTDSPSTDNLPRFFVSSGGSVQLVVPAGSGSASFGMSAMYPTN